MTDTTNPTQSVVIQPAAAAPQPPPLSVNVTVIGEWALALIAIATLLALVSKMLTREVNRDLVSVRSELSQTDHRARNAQGRVDALEHLRTGDLERIVRVEVAVAGFEKGIDRVERTITDRFDTLADSIREVRIVAPRGERA